MRERQGTIQVEPDSDLAHLLDAADAGSVLLERQGVRYTLNRVDTPASIRATSVSPTPGGPDRLLRIIGLGASANTTDIAIEKHDDLADVADHRRT